MRAKGKYIMLSALIFVSALSILSTFTSAKIPPEWVVATGRRIEIGTELNSYTRTYNYDETYHEIEAQKYFYGGPWMALAVYTFGGIKCSKVKMYIMLDTLHYGEPFTASAKYSGESFTLLGDFDPDEWVIFNLNTQKYLVEIKIYYYLSSGPDTTRTVLADYIRVLTVGLP